MEGRKKKRPWVTFENKGFSLIELIVIVLILGIASGSMIVSVNMARSHDAMRCAKNIAASLERTRAEALSKTNGSVHLELSAKSDGYYTTVYYINGGVTTTDEIKVGTRGVKIQVYDGLTTSELGVDVMNVSFSFSKSTGEFIGSFYDKIEVIGSDIANVELVKETGRSFVSAP